MTPRPNPQDAAQALADGLSRQIEGWALARSGDAAAAQRAAQAARQLSLATSEGHVCLPLQALCDADEADSNPATLRRQLLASSVVGNGEPGDALPLVLDSEDRLYLRRHFDQERRLAQRLHRAAMAAPRDVDAAARALLRQLFSDGAADRRAPDWQQVAAALALRRKLVVISGGPGTGKTSTVFKLLACLLAQQPHSRIALAAPTGKAAARLGQALRQHAATLPAPLQGRLPTQAATVHRLLGANPDGFVHDADNPLPIDVLVVDEASMLDLSLAARLISAVPDSARIVLLGDKDQLAAVESGAVFAELSADPTLGEACRDELADLCDVDPATLHTTPAAQAGALRDSVVWFTRNHRFAADSGIARAAAHIRRGDAAALLGLLRDANDPCLRWLDGDQAAVGVAVAKQLAEGYAPYFAQLRRDPRDVAGVHRAFERFRVLCALREGPLGVIALNEQLTRLARAQMADPVFEDTTWYPGRAVMVLRNDPLLQLFNGDIGIALPGADGALMVTFPSADGGFRALSPVRLPAHESAFAMTVHKSQGSEFDALLLLLPQQRSRVLTRELLYTAVTRARGQVWLAAGAEVLAAAVEAPTLRHSGLLARLREAAACAA